MGNENHHHHHYSHHHKNYHHNLHIHHRSTFLPLLCSRSPTKDVILPRWRSSGSSSCDDPLSPRISCMGQVKRNNKISGIGFSNSHRLSLTSKSSTPTSSSTSPIVKYSNLKKLFSSKNLKSTTTPTTTIASTTISSCGSRKQRVHKNHSRGENVGSISIENMDPPLPVIKTVNKLEEGSLWQRRSGGHGIKSLQVQQIHHPRIFLHPTSV
ncbi:hypothetical protein TanjilG_09234 [Lupinus angustifolius]|uniref:Uncharacterized protein n=2 Tax=Lupinus angustifolius TaxID=3871 RepID=A0A4P1QWS8_LUPAN|nr:hypothetical protein TanjilG_09234 [Lupinus angustifolius]